MREGNRGIFLERQLVAEAIPDTVASDKGIKRSVDKVVIAWLVEGRNSDMCAVDWLSWSCSMLLSHAEAFI